MTHPKTLIETWLPFDAVGAESLRERGASSALPPLCFLHVWWARRPLTISRAAIVASLLPAWDSSSPLPEGEGACPEPLDFARDKLRRRGRRERLGGEWRDDWLAQGLPGVEPLDEADVEVEE